MLKVAANTPLLSLSRDEHLAEVVERERARLRRFIRRRVADLDDVDDLVQDVLYEFVRAERLVEPIEQAGAWLARVDARMTISRVFTSRFPWRSTSSKAKLSKTSINSGSVTAKVEM